MATYIMALMNKHNLERYADYSAAGYVSLQGIDVKEVVVAENLTTLEGSVPATSLVLLKFGSQEDADQWYHRSEEHTSELQSLMRISYAVFCLKKKKILSVQNVILCVLIKKNINDYKQYTK